MSIAFLKFSFVVFVYQGCETTRREEAIGAWPEPVKQIDASSPHVLSGIMDCIDETNMRPNKNFPSNERLNSKLLSGGAVLPCLHIRPEICTLTVMERLKRWGCEKTTEDFSQPQIRQGKTQGKGKKAQRPPYGNWWRWELDYYRERKGVSA